MPTRHTQTLGSAEALARGCFQVVPVRTRTGVEQHADHGKVDHGAGTRLRVLCREPRFELGFAVHAAGLEMTPSAVVRDAQVGVAGAGDVGDFGRGGGQRLVIDAEPGRVTGTRAGQ